MAACGGDFTVAVTEDGELLAWGEGDHGQLGLGAVLHQQQPARAGGPELFANQRIRLAAAGYCHLAVVVEDGEGEGLEVVAALGDPRLRGLWNRGLGQVEARQTGLAEARGEAVLFLDDDDLLLDPAYLYRVWRVLSREDRKSVV